MKIGIIGASGYAGGELLRLLATHPTFTVSYISAGSNAGELITSIHPHLTTFAGHRFEATDLARIESCDLAFFALPHGESAKLIEQITSQVKIVDLGADYRLADSAQWQSYYGGSYAGSWTYGLPELVSKSEIAAATRVANPGCYATAIALSVAPAIKAGLINNSDIVAVAASGTTGAGRTAKVNLLGSEVMNSLSSYKFGGVHQHTPEIEQALASISGDEVKVSFTPILAPMPRGILATVTSQISGTVDNQRLREIYQNFFAQSPFVHILDPGVMPQTSSVLGTNMVHLQIAIDEHTSRLVVSTAIDNLGKGAAGQAIQNANLISALPEDSGLTSLGVR